MSLRSIVRRLGGDLYDGGRRANIPAPGHSRRDRSVSLWDRDGRLLIHTFGDGDWRTVRDHLRAEGLLDGSGGDDPPAMARVAPSAGRRERQAVARRLWSAGRTIAGTASERHCRLRGVIGDLPGPSVLRHHSFAPLAVYRPVSPTRPALLAAIQDCAGALSAVEVAYLTPGGASALDVRLARKTVGLVPVGSAVRIDPAGPQMLVAEGLFTTLSARARFALPAWALLSTGNLRHWTPPAGVVSVLVAGDRGQDGEASAKVLVDRLSALGLACRLAFPPPGFGDWNDVDRDPRRGGLGIEPWPLGPPQA